MLNNKGSRLRFKENNFQSVSHKNSKKERKGTIGSNSRKDSSVRLARATAWKKEKKTMQVSLHSRHSARNLDERFEARWKPKAREKGDWGGRGEKRDSYSEQICRRASYFSCERTASCSSELSVIILYLDYRTALGNSPSCERDPFTSTPPPFSPFVFLLFLFPALFARRARIRFPDRSVAARGKRAGRLANDFQSSP
jgi:hypothetical protein